MANSLVTKVELEGPRQVTVHATGYLDTNNIQATPILLLSTLQQKLMDGKQVTGFGVQRIQLAGSFGLVVQLAWNANTPQVFANLSGMADLQMLASSRFTPTKASGYDGSILLSTGGFAGGYVYGFTLVLELVKQY